MAHAVCVPLWAKIKGDAERAFKILYMYMYTCIHIHIHIYIHMHTQDVEGSPRAASKSWPTVDHRRHVPYGEVPLVGIVVPSPNRSRVVSEIWEAPYGRLSALAVINRV